MSGAGSSTVAFAHEQSYLGGLVSTPSYYQPGKNVQVGNAELRNALQRMADPGNPEYIESVAGRLEGAFQVSFVLTNTEWHNLVFNNASNDGFTNGSMPSSIWYLGIDYLNGTAERALKGVVVTDVSIQYQEGEAVRIQLTCVYGDEAKSTSITPSSITQSGEPHMFHGAQLDVGGTTQSKLQSGTLSLENLARLQRGPSRKPLDAVLASPEESLESTSIFSETDQINLAYGNSTAPSTSDISSASATFSFGTGGTTDTTYNLSGVKPDSYNWSDLVSRDSDLTEEITYHVNGVTVA